MLFSSVACFLLITTVSILKSVFKDTVYGSGFGRPKNLRIPTLVTMEIGVSSTFSDPGTISSIKMIVHRELKQECVTFYAF
jgi:hypothetical protein